MFLLNTDPKSNRNPIINPYPNLILILTLNLTLTSILTLSLPLTAVISQNLIVTADLRAHRL